MSRPNAKASSAKNGRLVNNSSLARVSPIIRGRSHDKPYSAGRLSLPWAVVILIPLAANRRSQKHASASPTPAAGPLISIRKVPKSDKLPVLNSFENEHFLVLRVAEEDAALVP